MLLNFKLFSKMYYAITLLAIITILGTLGFILIEDASVINSFYMTIITISTVGFGEIIELSPEGRLFTAFLIIGSFGIFAYAITSITKYIVGGEYKQYFKTYKMDKEIEKLDNHVIVCGFGRVGSQAVEELKAHNKQFLILEKEVDLFLAITNPKEKVVYLQGDATMDENLIKAGIHRANALITTLPSDAENLFVVLSAKELNPDLKIISRASQATSVKKLKMGGADNVIMPDSLGGAHMASLVVTPDVMEFLDHISIQGQSDCNLEEITFKHIPEEYQNKTIGDLLTVFNTGCNIIGYKNPEGEYTVNPDIDRKIVPKSKIFVLGKPEQIKKLNAIFGI